MNCTQPFVQVLCVHYLENIFHQNLKGGPDLEKTKNTNYRKKERNQNCVLFSNFSSAAGNKKWLSTWNRSLYTMRILPRPHLSLPHLTPLPCLGSFLVPIGASSHCHLIHSRKLFLLTEFLLLHMIQNSLSPCLHSLHWVSWRGDPSCLTFYCKQDTIYVKEHSYHISLSSAVCREQKTMVTWPLGKMLMAT